MAKKLIEFESAEGLTILIEGDVKNAGGMENMSTNGEKAKGGKLEDALESVKGFANSFWQTVKSIDVKPDEVEVKVGLTFKSEPGKVVACFVKIAGEATFEVTLKWKTENKEPAK